MEPADDSISRVCNERVFSLICIVSANMLDHIMDCVEPGASSFINLKAYENWPTTNVRTLYIDLVMNSLTRWSTKRQMKEKMNVAVQRVKSVDRLN